jgi:hypothetical protein
MAKSRLAAALLLALFPVAAWGQPAELLTAEGAVEHQRRQLQAATGTAPCDREAEGGEIVVCGRIGPDPNRVEVPRFPGDRVALLPGEPPSGRAALDATAQSPCTTVGPHQRCSGGLDVFRVVGVLVKIGKHLLDPGK